MMVRPPIRRFTGRAYDVVDFEFVVKPSGMRSAVRDHHRSAIARGHDSRCRSAERQHPMTT